MGSDGVAFLRADVEWFCGELVDLTPAVRLQTLAGLGAVLEELTPAAMTAAKDEG